MNSIKYPFFIGLYHLIVSNKNIFENKKEVVHIVGNGWASYYFVSNLDKNKYIPVVISPNKFMLNTTKLIDSIDSSSESNLLHKSNKYKQAHIHIEDTLKSIDHINKEIKLEKSSRPMKYKHLVLSVGSTFNDYNIPGVNSNSFKFKNIFDVDKLRIGLTKTIHPKAITVIGGGPTGVELSLKLSNLGNKVKLVEGLPNILNGYETSSQKLISKYLENKGVELCVNSKVKEIMGNQIMISKNDKNISINHDLCIWVGGVKINIDKTTQLYTDLKSIMDLSNSRLTVQGVNVKEDFSIGNDIYCIGDMVVNKGPPTAQNAKNQAKWLAQYFNSGFNNKYLENKKFEIKSIGKIIHLESKIYIESSYYNGFVPKCFDRFIQFFYYR